MNYNHSIVKADFVPPPTPLPCLATAANNYLESRKDRIRFSVLVEILLNLWRHFALRRVRVLDFAEHLMDNVLSHVLS